MTLKIIEESVEKDISFLEGVEVEFVSLVRHGAAQMPFRVIKSDEKGGESNKMMVIQSILVPEHLTLADFAEQDKMAWLAEAQTEKSVNCNEYRKFEQADAAKFIPDTLKMVKLHGEGIWALAGQLKKGVDVDKAITLGAKEALAAKEFPAAPMDSMLAPTSAATVASFRDLFYKELDSMLNIVTGTLNQTGGTSTKRKTMVLSAVDAFRSFLVIGLDALGTQAAKIEKVTKIKTEVKAMELFETKEEFATAVGAIIAETVPGLVEEAVKTFKEDLPSDKEGDADTKMEVKSDADVSGKSKVATKTADSGTDDKGSKEGSITELEKKLAGVVDSVAALTKKWDNSLVTDPAAATGDDSTVPKDESGDDGKNKKSVFAGLLVTPA